MEIVQFITILGSIVGSFIYIITELRNFEKTIRDDMKSQSQRTDRLYEMFVDIQKENQTLLREMHGRICSIESKKV